jgi:predicted transposase YbfD/YdcC
VAPTSSKETVEHARNRTETRTVSAFQPLDKLAKSEWEPYVKTVLRVERKVQTRSAKTGLWDTTSHAAYYICNAVVTAPCGAKAIRGHWSIENTSHYTRDVSMGEDQSRIRSNPGVFARIRSFAYNFLKANKKSTLSQDRYRAALAGLKPLLEMLVFGER